MNKYSKVALTLCCFFMTITAFFYYPKWEQHNTEATISWDASGYYMYLPALFIYKDLKHCRFLDSTLAKYGPTPEIQQAAIHQPSGNYVMKYSSGQAVMMSPFFFAGHAIATLSGSWPADGFSYPYQISIGIGMFLYALAGLWLLRKILLHYFTDKTVCITLIALVAGTNYLNYAVVDQAMTHNPLFTLYAALIWATICFYKNPRYITALIIGLLTGLATLTRPTDVISLIIPLCWGIASVNDLKNRISFIAGSLRYFLMAGAMFLAVVSIQLFYWKYVSGEWVVYSYQDQGFSWLHPHIKDYTFSYRCGWLRFCPMMLLPFIGILPFIKRKQNSLAVLLFFAVNFYIVTAWDVWDYGGTAGRAMVQSYPVLMFPMAALIEYVNQRKILVFIFYPVFILFIYLNIWWTHNAHRGHVQVSELSHEYYWRVIGRWETDDFDTKLLDNKFSYRGYPAHPDTLYKNDFEQDTSANATAEGVNGKGIFIDKDHSRSKEYFIDNKQQAKKWIRVYANLHCVSKEWNMWRQPVFLLKFYKEGKEIQASGIKPDRFLNDNETKALFLDAKVPKGAWDKMGISFENAESDKKIIIDDLFMITFDE